MARKTEQPTLQQRTDTAEALAESSLRLFADAAAGLDAASTSLSLIAGEARDRAAELEHVASVAERGSNDHADRAAKLRTLLGLPQ